MDDYSYSKTALTQDLSDVSSIASTSTVNDNLPGNSAALAIRDTREAINKFQDVNEETDKDDDLRSLRKRLSSYAKNPRYTKALKQAPSNTS